MRLRPRCSAVALIDDAPAPASDSPRAPDQQVFYYELSHELVFSFYDSCRKDVLASAAALDADADLALLGAASVRVEDLVDRIAQHDNDPRTGLTHTLVFVRDKNQSLVSKTFEQFGKGVNMINNLSFFTDEPSNSDPVVILTLAPIRCVSCRTFAPHLSPRAGATSRTCSACGGKTRCGRS